MTYNVSQNRTIQDLTRYQGYVKFELDSGSSPFTEDCKFKIKRTTNTGYHMQKGYFYYEFVITKADGSAIGQTDIVTFQNRGHRNWFGKRECIVTGLDGKPTAIEDMPTGQRSQFAVMEDKLLSTRSYIVPTSNLPYPQTNGISAMAAMDTTNFNLNDPYFITGTDIFVEPSYNIGFDARFRYTNKGTNGVISICDPIVDEFPVFNNIDEIFINRDIEINFYEYIDKANANNPNAFGTLLARRNTVGVNNFIVKLQTFQFYVPTVDADYAQTTPLYRNIAEYDDIRIERRILGTISIDSNLTQLRSKTFTANGEPRWLIVGLQPIVDKSVQTTNNNKLYPVNYSKTWLTINADEYPRSKPTYNIYSGLNAQVLQTYMNFRYDYLGMDNAMDDSPISLDMITGCNAMTIFDLRYAPRNNVNDYEVFWDLLPGNTAGNYTPFILIFSKSRFMF